MIFFSLTENPSPRPHPTPKTRQEPPEMDEVGPKWAETDGNGPKWIFWKLSGVGHGRGVVGTGWGGGGQGKKKIPSLDSLI